ncbi:MAG: Hsp20/alpha crystallin family protein [Burkholderiaceae bacterium]
MRRDDSQDWMWAEAIAMFTRAERMRSQVFSPQLATRQPSWEPPIDMLELEDEVLIFVALPGVDAQQVETVIDGACLVVAGRRVLPRALRTAQIHRLELPQGRFERRIVLPAGKYATARRASENGCLVISLQKMP